MTKRKVAVLIGRFQPAHRGHLSNFLNALNLADKVTILVGSAFQPRTPVNPFKYEERAVMIASSIREERPDANISIRPLRDFKYSNNNWIKEVQEIVALDNPGIDDKDIIIMGYDKDDSSWYNHAFPAWDFIPFPGFIEYGNKPIDATKVRELYFEGLLDFIQSAVPSSVFEYMKNWKKTPAYMNMVEEYLFYKEYHKKWEPAPFVPVFQTTDAVVIQGGHILLIERGFAPGKGLWALPGGFLNPKELIIDCVIRELVEETRIKIQEIILRKAITYNKVFDHPDRDLRGRTITSAFLIELEGGDGTLPKVKGKDDAKRAKWFTLAEVEKMSELIYGDHLHIIQTMVARAKK